MVDFFNKVILARPDLVKDIDLDGFLAIRAMFLLVNEFEDKLNMVKRPKADEAFKKLNIETSQTYAGY